MLRMKYVTSTQIEYITFIHIFAVRLKCVFFLSFLYILELSPFSTVIGASKEFLSSLCNGKEVKLMLNTSSHQRIVEQQFDCFCKKVLRNQARNIYAENKRWKEKFISLEALTPTEIGQLSIHDTYCSEYVYFSIHDYEIPIQDILIAQAIESLSKRKQDIILLSFFLDMKDVDIAELMSLAKSTVHYHKENALNELRKFMEEHVDEK